MTMVMMIDADDIITEFTSNSGELMYSCPSHWVVLGTGIGKGGKILRWENYSQSNNATRNCPDKLEAYFFAAIFKCHTDPERYFEFLDEALEEFCRERPPFSHFYVETKRLIAG